MDLPDSINPNLTTSILEGGYLQEKPDFEKDAIFDGTYQQDFENWVSQHIPFRDNLIMDSCGLQRLCIAMSSLICNFEIYPTHFDTDVLYARGDNQLYREGKKITDFTDKSFENLSILRNNFAARHKDILIYEALVPEVQCQQDSLSNKYVNNPISYSYIYDKYLSRAKGVKNIDIWLNFPELKPYLFKSDHHQNIQGAYLAYAKIATELGFGDSLQDTQDLKIFEKPLFRGFLARDAAMTTIVDNIQDYYFDMSNLEVSINDEKATSDYLDDYFAYLNGEYDDEIFCGRYQEYFHVDYGTIEIKNPNAETNRELLIIGDSFSDCIERYFTKHFSTVYKLDPRHTDLSADEFLSQHPGISDVIFMYFPHSVLEQDDFHKVLIRKAGNV